MGGSAIAGASASGRGERSALRLLFRAHPLTDRERATLAPALSVLCREGLGPPVIELWVSRSSGAVLAKGVGRRSVLVAAGALEAVGAGAMSQGQAASAICHAAGLVRGGWVRNDLVVTCWSAPWLLLGALAHAVARPLGCLPLVALAWRLRGGVVSIAAVRAIQEGLPAIAWLLVCLGLLSYAMPMWERRWRHQVAVAGDRVVVDAGLAEPWARVLRRNAVTPELLRRVQELEPANLGLARLATVKMT